MFSDVISSSKIVQHSTLPIPAEREKEKGTIVCPFFSLSVVVSRLRSYPARY